ncbi:exonuclease domain-containing protein [Acidithiobacillus sp. AMEEHan]|uniref:3'-5' exonuclease family protein n=1 Tax=Acidithiobacillus sp. AMEEHan TaxID=2994951 RepID=UPI0027E4D5C9|nr:exonuclease domain-containing protein [Acidithiobacillus sp. AMEEHan]
MKHLSTSLNRLLAELEQPIVCLDLETTGGRPQQDRILEIGMVTLTPGQEPQQWAQLLNPGCPVSPYITQLTGIHPNMLRDMPRFEEIAASLALRLEGHIVVAHNARFDLAFLRQSFQRVEIPFQAKAICSVKLSRRLFPQETRHGLDAIIDRLEIPCRNRHRALDDARVVAEFLRRLADERLPEVVQACKLQWEQECLPPNLDAEFLRSIPNRPGVYLFFGSGEIPLYIGKSIHLRKRVLEHFRNDFRHDREMQIAQQVERIEWLETQGELGALLLESRLVKERNPLYNRQLRRKKELCTIVWAGPGSAAPQIRCGEEIRPGVCHGIFANRRSAKAALKRLAQEWGLCDIRLGLQKGKGACFGFQIKRCRGVCAGQESAAEHDERLSAAMQILQIQHWPFSGPIGIPEEDNSASLHVFDHWCHMGIVREDNGVIEQFADSASFDTDTYRILLRYLHHSPQQWRPLDQGWRQRTRQRSI